MTTFYINIMKLLHAIAGGVKNDHDFRALTILLATLLVGATLFYVNHEGWSVVDALYFSVMTMSTIGYGDLVPTTPISKIFTIIFTFLGVGVFITLNAKIVVATLNQKKQLREKIQRKKAIRKSKSE